MSDGFVRRVGRPATVRGRDTIARVRIGDTVWTGTALTVTRYRDHSGRHITEVTLVDGIAL